MLELKELSHALGHSTSTKHANGAADENCKVSVAHTPSSPPVFEEREHHQFWS